jgi:hypothetical protein
VTRATDEIARVDSVSASLVGFRPLLGARPLPEISDGGEILTMRNGDRWFHPYNGRAPVRLTSKMKEEA